MNKRLSSADKNFGKLAWILWVQVAGQTQICSLWSLTILCFRCVMFPWIKKHEWQIQCSVSQQWAQWQLQQVLQLTRGKGGIPETEKHMGIQKDPQETADLTSRTDTDWHIARSNDRRCKWPLRSEATRSVANRMGKQGRGRMVVRAGRASSKDEQEGHLHFKQRLQPTHKELRTAEGM